MIDYNTYNNELAEVLSDNVYGGSKEHADLRIIYNDILNSVMSTSLSENNAVIPVKLTNVDREFVTQQAVDYFGKEKGEGLYSASAIIASLNEHLSLINDKIKSETSFEIDSLRSAGKQSLLEFMTIEEFRKRTK